jgi:undecaprenyl diphosphate synthase
MTKIPKHLGIIIDGNRRWAKQKGLLTFNGHYSGREKVRKIGRWCKERGIKILTIYGFSTENWKRSKIEVNYLMKLINESLSGDCLKEMQEDKIKIQIIGLRQRLPKFLQKTIEKAEELTKNNKAMLFNLALNYGGRMEIVEAIKKIILKKIPLKEITEELVAENLWTKGLPAPDLIIRTAGEQRLSNFLTWQSAYSELYFTQKYWPDFEEKDLDEALEEYDRRQRRFGK